MLRKWGKVTRKFLQMREVHVSLCATAAERQAVYRLRHEVFNDELALGYRHAGGRVEKPWDARSYHLQATVDGELAGCMSFYRLSEGPDDPAIDAFWGTCGLDPAERGRIGIGEQAVVRPAHRGGGVAVAMFWRFYGHLLEMGCDAALMTCLPELTRYYTPFGWQQVGEGVHPRLDPAPRIVLRHDLHHFGPMLQHASPLALQLARWRLRGSPVTRPDETAAAPLTAARLMEHGAS